MKIREKQELQKKTTTDLTKMVYDARMKLLSLQMEKGQTTLKDLRSLGRLRDDIARMLTVLQQKTKEVSVNE